MRDENMKAVLIVVASLYISGEKPEKFEMRLPKSSYSQRIADLEQFSNIPEIISIFVSVEARCEVLPQMPNQGEVQT